MRSMSKDAVESALSKVWRSQPTINQLISLATALLPINRLASPTNHTNPFHAEEEVDAMEICGNCLFDDLPNLVDLDVFSEGTSTFTPTLALAFVHTHTPHMHTYIQVPFYTMSQSDLTALGLCVGNKYCACVWVQAQQLLGPCSIQHSC